MWVAIERFDLRIPGCRSLKEKRHVVRSLTASLRHTFDVSVAEVDHQDLWQRTAIGVAVVGSHEYHLRRVLSQIEKAVDRWGEVELIDAEIHVYRPGD